MDFLIELLVDAYGELLMAFVPERGEATRRQRILAKLIAILVMLSCFALLFLGFFLAIERRTALAALPFAGVLLLTVLHIVLFLAVRRRRR